MCKCFFKFAKCLVVTFNIFLVIFGIGSVGGGIFLKTQIDLHDLLGDQYKDNVPPIASFLPEDTPPDKSDAMSKEADDFVEKSINDLTGVIQVINDALIGIGVVVSCIALFGIVVFTCCNQKNIMVIIYLALLIVMLIPFLAMTIVFGDESILKGHIFSTLDELALKEKFVNRFFMAALQSKLKCCGTRGNVDYYCEGIYDYACNPGCLTFKTIWDKMDKEQSKPMCKREQSLVDMCQEGFTKENCETKLNVPKPIDGRGSSYCKDHKYQDSYITTDDSKSVTVYEQMKKSLSTFDPAGKYSLNDDPRVFGSLMNPKDKGPTPGCGFVIWYEEVKIPTFLNYAMMVFLVLTLIIVFEIAVATLIIVCNKKNKRQESAFTQGKPPSKHSLANSS